MKFEEVDDSNLWKINMIKELTDVKQNKMTIDFDDQEKMSPKEIDSMIKMLSTM